MIAGDTPSDRIEFATSGSTAEPVIWTRSADQLRAEVELVVSTLACEVDHVVTFAPRTHLYGHLFGDVLPRLLGVGVDDMSVDPFAAPPIVEDRRTLYVCLPASWPVLHATARRRSDLHGSIAVHGAGPVTPSVTSAVRALGVAGLRAVELFGSTETGGVVHRPMAQGMAEPWRLFPDVALLDPAGPDGTCLLHVRSPRVARRTTGPAADSHRLDDVIRPLGSDRFLLLGRSGRLIKINGRRCDLGRIEQAVTAAVPGTDVACVGVPDGLRGEHYELFFAGPRHLDRVFLGAALRDLPLPRAVHRLRQVPRTITGKVKTDRLFASVGEAVPR